MPRSTSPRFYTGRGSTTGDEGSRRAEGGSGDPSPVGGGDSRAERIRQLARAVELLAANVRSINDSLDTITQHHERIAAVASAWAPPPPSCER